MSYLCISNFEKKIDLLVLWSDQVNPIIFCLISLPPSVALPKLINIKYRKVSNFFVKRPVKIVHASFSPFHVFKLKQKKRLNRSHLRKLNIVFFLNKMKSNKNSVFFCLIIFSTIFLFTQIIQSIGKLLSTLFWKCSVCVIRKLTRWLTIRSVYKILIIKGKLEIKNCLYHTTT